MATSLIAKYLLNNFWIELLEIQTLYLIKLLEIELFDLIGLIVEF